jgi:hypothetical protein
MEETRWEGQNFFEVVAPQEEEEEEEEEEEDLWCTFFWVFPRRLKYPEESTSYLQHGESLKTTKKIYVSTPHMALCSSQKQHYGS